MNTLLLYCFLLFMVYQVKSQNCGSSLPSDRLQSGVRIFTQDDYAQRNNSLFQVNIQFDLTEVNRVEYAVCSQEIKQYAKQDDGIYFGITGSIKNTAVVFTTVLIKDKRWKQVRVSYLISANQNIVLGNFPQNSNLRIAVPQQSFTVSRNIGKQRFKPREKYSVIVFISGVEANYKQFSLSIRQQNINPLTGNLSFVYKSSQPFEKLVFSYVIYQTSDEAYTYSLLKYQGTYNIEGPRSLTNTQILTSRLTICKKPDCRQNQEQIQGQCQCVSGFVRAGDLCKLSCQQFAYINDIGECTCIQGYNRINGQGQCTACNVGEYFQPVNQLCSLCTQSCQKCESFFVCDQCLPGFDLEIQDFFGIQSSLCVSVCGDGKKNQIQQCDDGNIINGDGCNQQCAVEEQFSCVGGSPFQASQCSPFGQDRTYMYLGRTVTLSNRTAIEIFLSQIPKCFDSVCNGCENIFNATVIESPIQLIPAINFISQNRFIISFYYKDANLVNPFRYQITLNQNQDPQYLKCFSQKDFEQKITRIVDPANI